MTHAHRSERDAAWLDEVAETVARGRAAPSGADAALVLLAWLGRRLYGPRAGWGIGAFAAAMKLANSGCGSKGLDFSSGWNCTPMNHG